MGGKCHEIFIIMSKRCAICCNLRLHPVLSLENVDFGETEIVRVETRNSQGMNPFVVISVFII